MRTLYEDLDEFDLDFTDGAIEKQVLHEMLREQRRLASRRAYASGKKRKRDDNYDDFDDDEYDDYDDFDDFDDDDESDSYRGSGWD